jgi:hypothetical protein
MDMKSSKTPMGLKMMNSGSKGSSAKKDALKKMASRMSKESSISKVGYKKINTSGLDNTQM